MQLYRYVDMKPMVENGAPCIILCVYPVTRETSACWFIEHDGKERRVLKGNGKRFAHEQHEWAKRSFMKRKSSQRWHLERQLNHANKLKDLIATDFSTSQVPGEHFVFVERMAEKVDIFDFEFP